MRLIREILQTENSVRSHLEISVARVREQVIAGKGPVAGGRAYRYRLSCRMNGSGSAMAAIVFLTVNNFRQRIRLSYFDRKNSDIA
jgi:hypothetical protein